MVPPLPLPCLCLVTDRTVGDERTLVERVGEAVTGGVNMVQLREKDLPGNRLLDLARAIKKEIAGRALLIINERADVAAAAYADGIQLGEQALPLAAARQIVGPRALIGRSVHSPESASKAQADGAHFLVVGTMYTTPSHREVAPAGLSLLRQIAQIPEQKIAPLPLIGIGGITVQTAGEVIQAGAGGVAVITTILESPDPQQQARELKLAMIDAWQDQPSPSGRKARGGIIRA